MKFWDDLLNTIGRRIAASVMDQTEVRPILEARAYRLGYARPQLKVKPGQFDDNIGLNLSGLLVNRIASQMLGAGFTWDFDGEEETEQERYISAVLDANKSEVLFHRAAVTASEAGTGYLFIMPDGVVGEDGQTYPRLQLVDPALVTMDTLPEDYEVVTRYTIVYRYTGLDDKEHARKREIAHIAPEVLADGTQAGGDTWEIIDYEQAPNGKWIETGRIPWGYNFAPMLHWQNLPAAQDVYGEPDLTEAQIALQERINFVASNISKLIRYYAHPMRYSVGANGSIDVDPGKMANLPGGASVNQLDALGDLSASMAYLTTLRQAFFACGRVVDIDSAQDKLGALTNFGLRVLYADNLAMIATHRELFGDMLEELARRLLILRGMEPLRCEVVWPDFLPTNQVEEMQAVQTKLDLGLMSKQTACDELGLDWEKESERIEDERRANEELGAFLFRQFDQGGRQPFGRQPQQQPEMSDDGRPAANGGQLPPPAGQSQR